MTAMADAQRQVAYDLLVDCFQEELAHLRLRMIRDRQQPRFEALRDSHPDIYADFVLARTDCHEVLKDIRERRIAVLRRIVEGEPP